MDKQTIDFIKGSIDNVYVKLQGLGIAVKPENVRILADVYDELEAIYKLLTEPEKEEEPGKEDDDRNVYAG